jgi:hypothetical protein
MVQILSASSTLSVIMGSSKLADYGDMECKNLLLAVGDR